MAPAQTPATATTESQRYRLLAPIARGGMAELHLAATADADECTKVVALKRVWPELAHDPDFVSMFTDEARLAVRLNHPNVVQTFEVGRMDGRLFMAMELLEGQNLNTVMARVRDPEIFPVPLRLKVLSHVLAGLHHAHELRGYDGAPLGVVHRDVSPHNVFITYDGAVKLLDFGIAKSLAASHQTRPGVMKGRISYMAPEQVRGETVDRQADIFSVGIMLWEAAANRRFWQGETEAGIVRKLISGTRIEVPALPPEVAPGLEEICRKALALDPEERYASAADLQAEVETLIAGNADSYERKLAAVVRFAFREERQRFRTLVERCLRGERVSDFYPLPGRTTVSSLQSVIAHDENPTVAAVSGLPRKRTAWPLRLGLATAAGAALLGGWWSLEAERSPVSGSSRPGESRTAAPREAKVSASEPAQADEPRIVEGVEAEAEPLPNERRPAQSRRPAKPTERKGPRRADAHAQTREPRAPEDRPLSHRESAREAANDIVPEGPPAASPDPFEAPLLPVSRRKPATSIDLSNPYE